MRIVLDLRETADTWEVWIGGVPRAVVPKRHEPINARCMLVPITTKDHRARACCISCGGVTCNRCGMWWKKSGQRVYDVCTSKGWKKVRKIPPCVVIIAGKKTRRK